MRFSFVLGQLNLTRAHLISSNLPNEGHVVLHGRTFCDLMWSPHDASTTCLQLGYSGLRMANLNEFTFESVRFTETLLSRRLTAVEVKVLLTSAYKPPVRAEQLVPHRKVLV